MKMKFDSFGAKSHLAPLFSFQSIIDTDIGLLNLIRNEYLDTRVFNPDFFKTKFYQQLYELYHRKEENFLYLFSKTDDKELLDSYYQEFKETKYKEILEMSISTEVYRLYRTCKNNSDFEAAILCKDPIEIEFLSKEPEFKNSKLLLLSETTTKQIDHYQQFFLKRLEELEDFRNLVAKTFYISTFGVNLNEEDNDIRSYDTIDYMIKRQNNFSIYDIYDRDLIEKGRK